MTTATVNPTLDLDRVFRSTVGDAEAEEAVSLPVADVIERVNEILGYDIFEADLLIEGYRELSAELLEWSEGTIHSNAETFPPE